MDDVRAVRSQAVEESFVFVIDSSQRDSGAWPTPSEYAVDFDRPFQNVVGFELLHAIVPRTEYVVEDGYNVLHYAVDGESKSIAVDPGDYNLVQLCEAMNAALEGVTVEPHSSPYQLRSRCRFYGQAPFSIDGRTSTLGKILGFYGSGAAFTSSMVGLDEERTFQGPFPGLDYETLDQQDTTLRQPFVPSVSGVASKVVVHCTSESILECRIVDAGDNVMGTATVSGGETPEVAVVDGLPLTAGMTYYVEIVASSETAGVYRSVPPDNVAPGEARLVEVDEDTQEETVTWNSLESGDALAVEMYVTVERHEVSPAGLVDLTGERIVIVRCEEVESRFHRSRRTEKFHGGVGMVRMGVNGFAENRFEAFPPRRLVDPIGKLKQLKFRLEKLDGSLYNARGVDHCLVCSVKYLVMHQPEGDMRILNPQYTPHVHEYLTSKWRAELEERDQLRFAKQEQTRAQDRVMDARNSSTPFNTLDVARLTASDSSSRGRSR